MQTGNAFLLAKTPPWWRRRWRPEPDDIAYDLWRLLLAYRWRIGVAIAFLLLAKVATVAVPLLLKRIIDDLSRPEQLLMWPVWLLITYAVVRFASTLFNELRDLLFSRVAQTTVATYAEKTFAHLHSLGSRFHSSRRTGGLLPDIDRGTAGIAFLLGAGLFTLVPILVEIGMVLTIMLSRYSGWYALLIAVIFVTYSAFTLYFTNRRAIFQRRVVKLDSQAKSHLADSLINADNIKFFAHEKLEAERFRGTMGHWAEAAVRNQKALFILHVGQSAIIALGLGSIMLLAGYEVWRNTMTVGDLVLINAYVLQVCLPLNALGFAYREVRDAWVNVERLFALLRLKPEIAQPPSLPPLKVEYGEVVFAHVNFHYEPERPILHDVSFRIPPGQVLAVVGGSGSGKSTLARLLLRLYDPVEGRVLVDGQNIAQVRTDSLRRAIGVVPQETILFNETIAYNIGYGRIEADMDEIVEVSKAAHIHDFIQSLPEGYETLVGERGVKLSGGERQRIAVARAMLKNPPILIFDEATSALDSKSESAIQRELNKLSVNRTTLIIAHRLSTIVDADQIIVMDRGRIVERGNHTELMKLRGIYSQLWLLQQRMDKESDAVSATMPPSAP